jgi:hypothetical protein
MVAGHEKKETDMRIKKITRGRAPVVLLAATPATLVFAYDSYDDCRNAANTRKHQCQTECGWTHPEGSEALEQCQFACSVQEGIDEAACHDEFQEWC